MKRRQRWMKRRQSAHEHRHERLKARVKKLESAMAQMGKHTHRLDDSHFTDTPWFPLGAIEDNADDVQGTA